MASKRITGLVFGIAAAIVVSLVGCSSETSAEEFIDPIQGDTPAEARQAALDAGDVQLAVVLEDEFLDIDEYVALQSRYFECWVEAELETRLGETMISPIDHWHTYTPSFGEYFPLSAQKKQQFNECQQGLTYIGQLYRDTHDPFMASDLLEFVTECLQRAGVETRDGATHLSDMFVERPPHGVVVECVTEGAHELYPDYRVTSLSY